MVYFVHCYTPEEIKSEYRKQAMRLHPDKGGSDAAFRELNEQYQFRLKSAEKQSNLPEIFQVKGNYTYHRVKVMYTGCDNHWYKFRKDFGADVLIDSDHLFLIKDERMNIF